ncbi:MAG: hydrolase TatD [Candidatus Nealsonbacteria bacterium CG_4_9_14_0_2_um_filter_37_38]|uniref:Hydrolase TatD n=1 Tax=Candidatus Nealsonbacteria bacterium CG_4_10_14_0_8_um_filter_37_14 TaxID=1974684 RepID=A0A2M7R6A7_9BACT|nr:MAG: hydrolase TatD [Candidatus Nealsonbacteria bacterium CG11_big_fil_rev_8_21_14_0_20_37_68]PIW92151.1 MAG: hydrolase TatD [Candidatus Nealsonbacteria bacterium CG_4_8_14_3_um_filter_37_23]PIY88535.1 MAG: hydrolase TatD [Candidatus Nealsonbacteria bacterium CG_4_10_14_0_8_um_filter_37_14]PJC51694.1 MAG: hydrolase TatD [Candidatus Nealsonbacteria bacterium CG_4_9_14_0_2_um_filter_37_38]
MLIDTHAHLNFNAFKDDGDEIIRRCLTNHIWLINVGSQYKTSKRAVEIAKKYKEGVYAAIGLHPIHLETGLVKTKIDVEEIEFKTQEEDFDTSKYRSLAKSKRVVAVGEIGLDYYYRPKTKRRLELFKEKQRTVLCKQLDLANELNLPIIFHCRMAHQDLLEILKSDSPPKFGRGQNSKLRGVVHCFTGNWEQAQKYLEMGFYLGFNGIIFKLDFDEIIKKVSLDRILIETDCPYLTPPPMTGRNEPLYVKYVAERIAKIKNLSFEEMAKITTDNAKKLFKI